MATSFDVSRSLNLGIPIICSAALRWLLEALMKKPTICYPPSQKIMALLILQAHRQEKPPVQSYTSHCSKQHPADNPEK